MVNVGRTPTLTAATRVSPATVGYVEAHGTGTAAGDLAEIAALGEVLGRAGAAPGRCAVGSVKSSIGLGMLLWAGIGDTIRVSLSADPVEEIKVGYDMLKSLGLRRRGVTVQTVGPDVESAAAMGTNFMEREPRSRVLAAGYRQGLKLGGSARG